jgi:hypothetical protein
LDLKIKVLIFLILANLYHFFVLLNVGSCTGRDSIGSIRLSPIQLMLDCPDTIKLTDMDVAHNYSRPKRVIVPPKRLGDYVLGSIDADLTI